MIQYVSLIRLFYLVLLVGFFAACKPEIEERPPNIILIMADDLGYNELGSYGQDIIQTPHLDKLAREGLRFTQFYSGSPVCAPSRCVLLTGKHTGHAYVRDNYELGGYTDETEGGQLPLKAGTVTLGTLMKARGYVTGAIGKWGLGGPASEGVPNRQGFDFFYGYLCQKQAHNYYPSHLWENEKWDTLSNAFFMAHQRLQGDSLDPDSYDPYRGEDYAPDLMTAHALQFIRDHRDTAFFLYLPFVVPHLALQVPEDEPSLAYYRETIPDVPYTGGRGYLPHPTPRAAYAAMITRMDRDIGTILELLREYGLDENTLVLFTSDNGPTYGGIGGSDTEYFSSAHPFQGLKGSVYEGGLRVPFIARWPGKIKPGVSDHVASFQDVMPTLAAISGSSTPPETDGISLQPTFLGGAQESHPYLYWEFPSYGGQVALRMGNWKAVRKGLFNSPDAPIELYDLDTDPSESQDVAAENPDVTARLQVLMQQARQASQEFPFPALDSLLSVDSASSEATFPPSQ